MDYIVNKTTTEMLAVKANSIDEAENIVLKGGGDIVTRNKSLNTRPRPDSAPSVNQSSPAGPPPSPASIAAPSPSQRK